MATEGLLEESDLRNIKEAERLLAKSLRSMDKAETCGMDCQSYRRMHGEIMDQLSNIKAEFFPKKRKIDDQV